MISTSSLLLAACTSPSSTLPGSALYSLGTPETLPASEAVAAADLDGDGIVGGVDLSLASAEVDEAFGCFGQPASDPECAEYDVNGDGIIGSPDLASLFGFQGHVEECFGTNLIEELACISQDLDGDGIVGALDLALASAAEQQVFDCFGAYVE